MIAVIQRVSNASVSVEGKLVSGIGRGLLIFLGISVSDNEKAAGWMAQKIAQLRIFSDLEGKMNESVVDQEGEILVASQFTLLADASHGNRPSYIKAARPEQAVPLYEYFCKALGEKAFTEVQQGIFGADMSVKLVNDGPVTIVLDSDRIMPDHLRSN